MEGSNERCAVAGAVLQGDEGLRDQITKLFDNYNPLLMPIFLKISTF